ncbi:MAG: helix-turn-helix domain-containing protein [Actinomyces sp.]|uniref:helix-turn-helix domain-containing protein n=1 Tax=uncultured Actinomyces sp. TaxID=249061 RepID=UPI002805C4B5|nr:helix-turn-helix domain-containing protein [uncultured Actinomyces sp.]MDU4831138.1 helix-turn-helix domain-containing protein [Actinomyces sp.]
MTATLRLRPGLIENLKSLHKIRSDEALARAIGVGFRTLTRVKSDPTAVQVEMIAGICDTFNYAISDVVEVVPLAAPKEK